MPKKASSMAEVPDEFMRCRAFRKHPEIHVHDTVIRGARNKIIGFVRRERCPYCTSESEVFYTLPGWAVIWRRRVYPDLYQVEGGADATDLKDEFIKRLGQHVDIEDPDEAALMMDRKRRREERLAAKQEAEQEAEKKTKRRRKT